MKNIFFILVLSAFFTPCFAATYYLSPSGSDAYSTAQAQSSDTPWNTFANAFGEMVAGDTLLLLDGTYSIAAGTGCINHSGTGSAQPPSGTSTSVMTIVQAVNEGSVIIDGTGGYGNAGLFLGRSFDKKSYIKIQGITFTGGGGALYNTSYCYIKNCGFNRTDNANASTFGAGTNDHAMGNSYDLIEDCWVWGESRLIAASYRADHIVWRRVVIRRDGYNADSGPQVGITAYDSQYISMQNVIILDGVLGGGTGYADFATAQHTTGDFYLGPIEWVGCISLSAPDSGYNFEAENANDGAITISNCVAWDGAGVGLSSPQFTSAAISNLTSGDSTYDGFRIYETGGTVKNLISYNATRYGVNSSPQPSYVNVYGAGTSAYNTTTCATGCLTSDPTAAALLYPVRVESGSFLDGTGDGGANYGATVEKRYGADGTFYGESGYNTLTSTALWPWPNEVLIKTQMAATSTRGFCADIDNPRTDTGKITLTSYIWEYLGNEIPSTIYGVTPNIIGCTITGGTIQ